MRMLLLPLTLFFTLLVPVVFAQQHDITKAEYDKAFNFAVSETNAHFPFLFKVSIKDYENGHIKATEDLSDEREAAGVERMTQTVAEGEKKTVDYEIKTGFGKVYCSSDGKNWSGPQQYECFGPRHFYGPREPESTAYTVTPGKWADKDVMLYREYVVYPAIANGKRAFSEEIATINSRGFFIKIEGTEGTLDPKETTLTRLQTWDFTATLPPVVAPK